MERINPRFFYHLGALLKPLTEMKVENTSRVDIWLASLDADSIVRSLLDFYSALTVCRRTGLELNKAVVDVADWMRKTPGNEWEKKDYSIDAKFRLLIDKAKEFETILCEELQTLATYHVTQKGNYSTSGLIEQTENILPESVKNKMAPNIVEEIRNSGRCLVFDNSTASGFHILRATELVMHEYYLAICKPKPKPSGRLKNWGEYLAELKKSTDPDVQKVVTLLNQIKDDDRNLIMHPERVLSPDEAFSLFEIAKSSIIVMGEKLPKVKKKKK